MKHLLLRLFLLSFLLLQLSSLFSLAQQPPTTFKVGLILNLNSTDGQIYETVTQMAVNDFYNSHPNSPSRLLLLPRNSGGDVVNAADAALGFLINDQVHAILGPQTSIEASFVANLGAKAEVPIVSFSATSPSISPSKNNFFVRAAPSDAAQVRAIAAFVKAFGWRRVVPVYEDSDYGTAFIPFLVDALDEVEAQVPYRWALSPSATDDHILAELYRLSTLQTRVFVVHVTSVIALRLFQAINEAEMMSQGFVWITTQGITSHLGSIDQPDFVNDYMQGVVGVMPHVIQSNQLRKFRSEWRSKFFRQNPRSLDIDVSNFAYWCYNTVWAMALAANAVGGAGPEFDMPKNGSTDFARIGVSKSGTRLLDTITNISFNGLGGKFRLEGGELNVTAYTIENIIGNKPRRLGYWTSKYGLSRQLNWSSEMDYSTMKEELGPIIWPGETTAAPKGWTTPINGDKLRIVVPAGPVAVGFHSFLNVERSLGTDEVKVSGFVIDVFEAAVKQLPYALQFEYVAFALKNGSSAGNYDAMARAVGAQEYDGAVGDITITANRSMYVDFTLPYTVSGVSMVVPVKNQRNSNAWIFLKPLTLDLWLVSGAFFLFTGLVVWALEHRTNDEFQGRAAQQIGTIFYFSFSTLVFAHRENLKTNLSRFVIIIWVFVVLILTSSYTASLTSMLTVQKFTPTINDFNELKNNGDNVGFLKNSFTKKMLLQLGFHEGKLHAFTSPQQYQEALRNGSVAAIIDEIPYLRVFLKDYCNSYTMTGVTYKTGGFGFAFPKGSPLVADLSRAILNITEGDKITEIEKSWFGDESNCPSEGSSSLSQDITSLSFQSFWGLFLLTGAASLICCLIYLATSFYKNRDKLKEIASSKSSLWRRFSSVARHSENKDGSNSHHNINEQGIREETVIGGNRQYATTTTTSPSSFYAESPMSISNRTYEEGSTPLHEHASLDRPVTP